MKSVLIAAPILGLVAAKHPHPKPCSSQSTVYEFTTQTYTVTVPPPSSVYIPTTSVAPAKSTKYLTSVIYVTPSPAPYYPLPNGTFNNSHPSTGSPISYVLPSSSADESAAAPAETNVPAESSYAAIPVSSIQAVAPSSSAQAEAPIPTSETPATPAASTSPNPGADAALGSSNAGQATFYGGNTAGGMCSFTGYTLPAGIYGTALSDSNWASAGNCGACISVTGPSGNKIKAMITDQCPGCGTNHLDLYPDAFAALAAPSKGIINVSWAVVPCGITSPIVVKNKSGTSPYWFSMQVMNANVPVAKLEVSTDAGKTWKATTRQPYNFFENASGFGTSSVDVRVTSVNGGTVTVKGVSVSSGVTATASGNFS